MPRLFRLAKELVWLWIELRARFRTQTRPDSRNYLSGTAHDNASCGVQDNARRKPSLTASDLVDGVPAVLPRLEHLLLDQLTEVVAGAVPVQA